MIAIALLAGATMAVSGPMLPPRGIEALGLKRNKLDVSCSDGGRYACEAPQRVRYPSAAAGPREVSAKDRAFAANGTRCPLMGPVICPSRATTIYRSGQDPVRTILGSLVPGLTIE